jgi:hypothetical protein
MSDGGILYSVWQANNVSEDVETTAHGLEFLPAATWWIHLPVISVLQALMI